MKALSIIILAVIAVGAVVNLICNARLKKRADAWLKGYRDYIQDMDAAVDWLEAHETKPIMEPGSTVCLGDTVRIYCLGGKNSEIFRYPRPEKRLAKYFTMNLDKDNARCSEYFLLCVNEIADIRNIEDLLTRPQGYELTPR